LELIVPNNVIIINTEVPLLQILVTLADFMHAVEALWFPCT
jgi:hypothetical protein